MEVKMLELATIANSKFDKIDNRFDQVNTKIENVYSNLDSKIEKLNTELRSEISQVKIELKSEINQLKTEFGILKWLMGFMLSGTVALMTGVTMLLIKNFC